MDPKDLIGEDDKRAYKEAARKIVKALNEDYLPENPIFGMLKDLVYELRDTYGD